MFKKKKRYANMEDKISKKLIHYNNVLKQPRKNFSRGYREYSIGYLYGFEDVLISDCVLGKDSGKPHGVPNSKDYQNGLRRAYSDLKTWRAIEKTKNKKE